MGASILSFIVVHVILVCILVAGILIGTIIIVLGYNYWGNLELIKAW